jgi:sugar (pentulose or hexulose) kinase
MLKCPVVSLDFNDVSSLGACLAAGLGVGVYDTMQQAFDATASLRNPHPVMPVPEWEDALDVAYQRYLTLYPTLKPIF